MGLSFFVYQEYVFQKPESRNSVSRRELGLHGFGETKVLDSIGKRNFVCCPAQDLES